LAQTTTASAFGSQRAAIDMTQPTGVPTDARERPLLELLSELWENSQQLVRQEFQLARVELDSRIDQAKSGLMHAALAGAVLYAGVLALIAAVILLLAEAIAAWLAAAIVGVVTLGVGFALTKKAKHEAAPEKMKLERTAESVRKDVQTFQEAVK
jgi:hypothetical protein